MAWCPYTWYFMNLERDMKQQIKGMKFVILAFWFHLPSWSLRDGIQRNVRVLSVGREEEDCFPIITCNLWYWRLWMGTINLGTGLALPWSYGAIIHCNTHRPSSVLNSALSPSLHTTLYFWQQREINLAWILHRSIQYLLEWDKQSESWER